jgi:hypothetical protein
MANKAAAATETVETRENAAEGPLLDTVAIAIKKVVARATAREIARAKKTARAKTQAHDHAVLTNAKIFARAADRLLRTADQVLAETRQGRKETAELLERLEARLASHG